MVSISKNRGIVNVYIQQGTAAEPLRGSAAAAPALPSRITKYKEKHIRGLSVAKKLEAIGERSRANRMRECSTAIRFAYCDICKTSEVIGTDRCRDRFCPTCNWRLSEQRYIEMMQIMERVTCAPGDVYYLTLTVRNPAPADLNQCLIDMSASFNRLATRRPFRAGVMGWARSLEITYNAEANTFHPHYHVILVMEPGASLHETTVREWWKQSAKLDYNPQVDLRAIHNRRGGSDAEAVTAAVVETFKYSIKDKDLDDMPLASFRALVNAIKGKRLIAFGGLLKDIRADLGMTEADQATDETETTAEGLVCPNCSAEMALCVAKFSASTAEYDQIYRLYSTRLDGEITAKVNDLTDA